MFQPLMILLKLLLHRCLTGVEIGLRKLLFTDSSQVLLPKF